MEIMEGSFVDKIFLLDSLSRVKVWYLQGKDIDDPWSQYIFILVSDPSLGRIKEC